MIPRPEPVGMTICEQIIVDRTSGNVSLISIYTGRWFSEFPTPPIPFSVFCSLKNSLGTGIVKLRVYDLADLDPILDWTESLKMPDRIAVHPVHFRVRNLRFPSPGSYWFVLEVDGEHVAERSLRVYDGGKDQ